MSGRICEPVNARIFLWSEPVAERLEDEPRILQWIFSVRQPVVRRHPGGQPCRRLADRIGQLRGIGSPTEQVVRIRAIGAAEGEGQGEPRSPSGTHAGAAFVSHRARGNRLEHLGFDPCPCFRRVHVPDAITRLRDAGVRRRGTG